MSNIGYQAVLPEGWPRPRGFSHGVIAKGASQVRIAGQVGTVPGQREVEANLDFGTQWTRALANVVAVVRAAGGEPTNLVALRVYVTQISEFNENGPAIGQSWMESLGKHFPAMTLVQVSGLLDPNAIVEIEAEAILT
jgi:enamine deaminase RidA (YjgF/YER057c/UK114 family)